jgi:two-component system sensor histidine kinase PilS (NtrC family)
MRAVSFQPGESGVPIAYWRSLRYYNLYRLVVAGILVLSFALLGANVAFGVHDPRLFLWVSGIYVLLAVLSIVTIGLRRPDFSYQLGFQITTDIVCVVVLMYASGGVNSGLGLLLVASLAAAGLISRGRQAVFFAALATIAVLLQQGAQVIFLDSSAGDFFQSGLLSMGYFATAWLARTLATYTVASERLAQQRGIDLENLAQVNQLVIQDMQDGVLVVDEQGRVRQSNSQVQRLLGIYRNHQQGMSLQDYLPALAERFRHWREGRDGDLGPLKSPASGRQIRARFVPVDEGRNHGALVFLEDLSLVQAQAQQLKLAALGRLTANIAHEIRNPLSAISHATQLLQEEEAADKAQARLLQIIQTNTYRLDNMVQDVLQLNRRDRAQVERIKPALFLPAFVDEFCQVENIPRNAFSIEIDTTQDVCFDRAHLNQVLWNLCRNAWRHSARREGSIRLCVTEAHWQDIVQLDVIDDGPGVDPDLQLQLFEPFFTTESKGTGLGLYIAKEVCEANGATLDYIEVAPGGQFRICCKGGAC